MCRKVYNSGMARTFSYKGVRVNSFGLPVWSDKTRVKTEERERKFYHLSFVSPFKKHSPKNLVVMYDIPERKKKERDWLRRQLIEFGYTMIQRSVWVGPSPLPREFVEYVRAIGLRGKLKTFKLAKPYSGKESRI